MKDKEKLTKNIQWKKTLNWIILGLIILLAILLRWRINFGNKLMSGVNALYYPVQVRSLLENGHLAYSDLPFLFWFEALIARILLLFNIGDLSGCIILASKLTDSIIPPFSAIPVFLLAREWQNKDSNKKWLALIPSAFSVLYFSPLVMVSDFQKNAVGILWVYSFVYFLYKSLQHNKLKYHIFTAIFFILVALTHIGSLGLALLLLLIVIIAVLFAKKVIKGIILFSFILAFLIIGTLTSLYFFFDSVRIERLFSSIFQFKLFENNLFYAIINKYPIPIAPPDIVNMIMINLITIFGLLTFIRKKISLQKPKYLIILVGIIASLIMSSLIIGQEWFGRLLMMAYVPASLVLAFLIIETSNSINKFIITGFAILLILASVTMGISAKRPPSITEEAYLELNQIKQIIDNPSKTLIVARHGLEFWVAWILRTHVAQDRALSPETWDHYDNVLFLEQFAGSAGFGPSGPFGKPFREVIIPPDAEIIYEGEYFRLARVLVPPPFPPPIMF